jgi:hypothetical protein
VECLEARDLPASHAATVDVHHTVQPVNVAAPPYAADAPWAPKYNRKYVLAQPKSQLQAMYFNSPSKQTIYDDYFKGVLRRWTGEADSAAVGSNAGLEHFLAAQLNSYFAHVRGVLARVYPGQTNQTYRLLMDMNLAHGYLTYATEPLRDRTDAQLLHLPGGDCAQISDLLSMLLRAQGIKASEVVQSYNYRTPIGHFIASHDVVYAKGLWLDAEINTAFAVSLSTLHRTAPAARLPDLLSGHHVFGFYNDYLQPHVRLSQLRHGLDGGIIAFYYQYYFQGIGQGHTQITLVPED